ncbi:MAG: S1C family serine protease [Pirellula sp.]
MNAPIENAPAANAPAANLKREDSLIAPAEVWSSTGGTVESPGPTLSSEIKPSEIKPVQGGPHESRGIASHPTFSNLLASTVLSLSVVLILLVCLRFLLPPMLESSRYSWHRGQLRAEYELAGDQLERVSWEGLSQVSRTVAKRVSPSVVHITVNTALALNGSREVLAQEPWRANPELREYRNTTGQGSGIIVREDGYILTNHHVLEGVVEATVVLADDRAFRAEIIGVDRTTDLALLKIDAEDLMPIAWGDSDEVDVGSPVWAVGSPFGLTGSVSFGILSGKHRVDLNANQQYRGSRERITSRYSDLMQSDVAVNPGNSGGPLVNGRGELIGVNTAIVGESYRGVSFSIPSRLARQVLDQFMAHGRVRRGWLGVELTPELPVGPESASGSMREDVAPAVVVRAVVPDSPAAKAGVYPGDRITHFNGVAVVSVEQLIDEIRDSKADQKVIITIRRDGESIELEATLGELKYSP